MDAVVVGAGTFGASLAWWLARGGDAVTLVDQFAPGDARSSSGDATRLIRYSHGADADYAASARRAWTLWRELEAESATALLVESGVSWFAHGEDGWEARSAEVLARLGIPAERLDVAEAARLFPELRGDDLAFVLHEPEAGVLRAAPAVRTLAAQAEAHGARILRGRATPEGTRARLADGTVLEADAVVWACGGWLPDLFPGLVAIRTTRQDLFFLAGGPAWAHAPGWVDYDGALYGTGDVDGLGVKAAPDAEGPALAPDAPLPGTDRDSEAAVRAALRGRFPRLADAPLVSSRTCRYELSPDSHFLAGPHPEQAGTWLVGGGSGHGFKHGPAMAELLAAALRGGTRLPDRFALGARVPRQSLRTAGSNVAAA
jgi:sarcosine oxidase